MVYVEAGDHIFCYRKGKTYTHHGIYEGDGMVIHMTKEQPQKGHRCPTLGCESDADAGGVVRVCFKCFSAGDDVYIFDYGVSFWRFFKDKKGTCSFFWAPYTGDQVVERARYMMKKGFGKYSFLGNNCESFAFYCTNGERVSQQVKYGILKASAYVISLAMFALNILIIIYPY